MLHLPKTARLKKNIIKAQLGYIVWIQIGYEVNYTGSHKGTGNMFL
jgi:hypothetical protein